MRDENAEVVISWRETLFGASLWAERTTKQSKVTILRMSAGIPHQRETDLLLELRPEFPILERSIYLISNSLGAMPRGVYDATREYCDTWATRGVRAWEEQWWEMSRVVGDEIGLLMNAAPGTI